MVHKTEPKINDAYDLFTYDRVISNFGLHYQEKSHIFICPLSGVYQFSVSLLSQNEPNVISHAKIMLENKFQGSVFSGTDQDATNGQQASITTITECLAGNRVWVEAGNTNNQKVAGWGEEPYTSFSGFLLFLM